MRGSPFRELLLMLALGALLLPVLIALTRETAPVEHLHTPPAEREIEAVGAWLDLRFSHAPDSVKVWQGDRLLMEDGGDTRLDADAELNLSGDAVRLRMEVEWAATVEQAYAELTLEPEFRSSKTVGFWGSGRVERRWELQWTDAP